MKKSLIALALVGAFAAPAFAQTAAPAAAEAAPASPHTLTANVGLFSDYRFRGISQTATRPALQGALTTPTPVVSTSVTGTPTLMLLPVTPMATLKWISTVVSSRPLVILAWISAGSFITTRVAVLTVARTTAML